jgi:hypothetical protein
MRCANRANAPLRRALIGVQQIRWEIRAFATELFRPTDGTTGLDRAARGRDGEMEPSPVLHTVALTSSLVAHAWKSGVKSVSSPFD